MKEYAAVLIPTLNRVDHLRTTVESLKKCIGSEYTDVYIGLDYPPSSEYEEGYKKVCEYLETGEFSRFNSFRVVKRVENYGVLKNLSSLRELVYEHHDTFITMQDDIEVSKNFLVYINSALEYYEKDDNVVAVSGYSYPIKWNKTEGANALKTNYIAAEWGIGFWKNKFETLKIVLEKEYLYENFIKAYKEKKLELMTDACIKDYSNTVLNLNHENSLLRIVCDVSMRIYLPIANKYVIMPTVSHTRNHGFDGSGLYCGRINPENVNNSFADTYDYDSQPIDDSDSYIFIPSEEDYIDINRERLNTFDRRDQREIKSIRRKLKTYVLIRPTIYKGYLHIRSLYRGIKFKTKQLFNQN